jgi:chromosome segregation and condensation protein ScpB
MHINLFKKSTTDAKIQVSKDILAFVVFNRVVKLKVKNTWKGLPLLYTTDKNFMENINLQKHRTPPTKTHT